MKSSRFLIETLVIVSATLFLIADITQIILNGITDNNLIFLIGLWVCIIIALWYNYIGRFFKLKNR